MDRRAAEGRPGIPIRIVDKPEGRNDGVWGVADHELAGTDMEMLLVKISLTVTCTGIQGALRCYASPAINHQRRYSHAWTRRGK